MMPNIYKYIFFIFKCDILITLASIPPDFRGGMLY